MKPRTGSNSRAKWLAQRPQKGSFLAYELRQAELIVTAYYGTPETRLRLENISLKAQLKLAEKGR